MNISTIAGKPISASDFLDILQRSGLATRRRVDDPECIAGMLAHADILCTAWDGDKLVGVARSVTDFVYCCYLSDLAVDAAYQHQGIGKALIQCTRDQLKAKCKLILLSAPAAQEYYPKIGFEQHPSAWTLSSEAPSLSRISGE